MTALKTLFCAAVASLSLAACETDSWSPAQRNAAVGGAIGAAAGAAIADDDLSGALIGGALGAAVGYYTGCKEQGGCYVGGKEVAAIDIDGSAQFAIGPTTEWWSRPAMQHHAWPGPLGCTA